MIKREDLVSRAHLKGLASRLAEIDYLHDVVLLGLSREFGNKLIFKGGTCLYKVYNLDRFSEDLDFTTEKGFKPKDFFKRLPSFFNLLGIQSNVKVEEFQRGINVYVNILGPLYDGRKETITRLILNLSTRERILLPVQRVSYQSLYSEIRSFDLFVMHEKEILAEKIRAIYGRDKARDVYDLWYLLKRRGISFEERLAKKKLASVGITFGKKTFSTKVDKKKMSWERDLGGLIAGELPSFASVKKEIEQSL